jgi:uncharacterized damage-inducible protein DinB
MNPEQAVFMRDMFLVGHEQEMPLTKKVIERVPDAKKTYKPDAKAKSAHELAWHIASTEAWFLEGVIAGKFAMPEGEAPTPATIAEILSWYEATIPPLLAKVKAMNGADLAKVVPFFGLQYPNVIYLSVLHSHSVHHRGQLSTYLRPMGSTVPSIYGGSADEAFM